jgi:small conductance mechanosensitive channel
MLKAKEKPVCRGLGLAAAASLVVSLTVSGLVAAPAAAQTLAPTPTPEAGTAPAPSMTGPIEVSPVARDEQIATRLQGILESTDWFDAPGVTVENGVVFLSGSTAHDSRRAWAGELAARTRDVVAVVNRITVIEGSPWDVTPAFQEVRALTQRFIRSLPLLALAIAVVVLSWMGRGLVMLLARPILARRIRSPLLLDVATRLAAVPLVLLGMYLALQFLGLTRLALTVLGGTGIAGLIVGIGFRDIVENFLASILLSTDRPFDPGDTVQIGQRTGVVQSLTTRATLLMGFDGNHIQIPNATVYKSEIINFTTNPNQRFTFAVGITKDSSISKAQEAIMAVLTAHPTVLATPEPLILADKFAGSSVDLSVSFWINSSEHNGLKVKSAIIRLTKRALREAGIEIADPTQEIVFPAGALEEAPRSTRRREREGGEKDVRRAAVAPETPYLVTPAEGELKSDDEQIQKQVEQSRETGGGTNLLTG